MKKPLGYALMFTLGTMVSGTVATAAVTNIVQAHKQNAKIVVSGNSSTSTELIYNGRAYLPIGDIQAVIAKTGATSKWTAGKLVVTLPTPTTTTSGNGSSGVGTASSADNQEILAISQSVINFAKILEQVGTDLQSTTATDSSMETSLQTALTGINNEIQSMKSVTPGDDSGTKILNDYVDVLTQYQNGLQELLTSLQNNDTTLANQGQTDLTNAETAFKAFEQEWQTFCGN